jgi:hypothetical protein
MNSQSWGKDSHYTYAPHLFLTCPIKERRYLNNILHCLYMIHIPGHFTMSLPTYMLNNEITNDYKENGQ